MAGHESDQPQLANHAFVDGNKRTGLVCAVVFLARNGVDTAGLDEDAAFDLVVGMATGLLVEVDDIAGALRVGLRHPG